MRSRHSIRFFAFFLSLLLLVSALPLYAFSASISNVFGNKSNETQTVDSQNVTSFDYKDESNQSFPCEIAELRTENVKHFDNGDGTYVAISYGNAVHRKDAKGEWQDIDNTLTLQEDRGVKRYNDANERISFSSSASSENTLWELSENGYFISLALSDANMRSGVQADVKNHASRAEQIAMAKQSDDTEAFFRIDNSTKILYQNVLPDVDLEYVLSGNDVKESILVKHARDQYDFSFRLFLSGLIPKATDDGRIFLLDAKNGEKVYVLPAPYMLDADYEYSDAVAYYLTDLGGGEYRIVVSASSEWINDPERVFPVVIDPTLTSPTDCTADTSVNSNYPDNCYGSSTVMRIGTTHVSFIKSSVMPELPAGATVYDGRVHFAYYLNTTAPGSMVITQHIATRNWSEESTTWNEISQNGTDTSLGLSPAFSSATLTNISGTTQWAEAGITEAAQYWYNGTRYANNFNYGIGLKWNAGPFLNVLLHTKNAANGYTPYFSISYLYAGPSSGVYAFKKSGTNSYADCTKHDTFGYDNEFTSSTSYYIGQCTLESSPTQGADAFNALFKLIFRPATQDYVIRSMLDNLLVLTHVSSNHRLKKQISITDDTTTSNYSWKITRISQNNQNNYYIWFETSGGTKYYLTMPSSGRLTTVSNRDSATVWSLPQYTETAQGISVYEVPDSQFVQPGDSVNMSWVTNIFKYSYYSTAIGVNTPGEVTYSVSNNDATGTATSVASVSNDGIIHFNTQKAGLVRFTALYSTGVSFSTNFYSNPTSDTFFLLQNTLGWISFAEGTSSGATRTALSNDSVTDRQTWQLVDSEWTGYYYIRNVGTGLYLSVPDNTTMDANLVMVSSPMGNRQAWKFTQTNSGRWKIRSRRDELANNNLFINVDPSTNKLIQGTFVLNNSYYDEFNKVELGGDVVLHRVLNFGYVYNPSEEISVLAKYYSKYTLIHNDIGMDLPTAKNLLQNSKIMVFNGHGDPSKIRIHEKPIGHIRNTDIFTLGDPDNSLDLSGTDIVIFEGCSTAGNPCPYCLSKNEELENYYSPVIDDHYPDCPYSDVFPINLPLSAILAGARVSIGWKIVQYTNFVNDWTERFFTKLATVNSSTGELYTACQAWLETNNYYKYTQTGTNAEYSQLYENGTTGLDDEFRLSD